MDEDRRSVLEAIAFGADPKVTPADRLKALELLQTADSDDAMVRMVRELTWLSGEELDRELAGYMTVGYSPEQFAPEIDAMAERRAQALADELCRHGPAERSEGGMSAMDLGAARRTRAGTGTRRTATRRACTCQGRGARDRGLFVSAAEGLMNP